MLMLLKYVRLNYSNKQKHSSAKTISKIVLLKKSKDKLDEEWRLEAGFCTRLRYDQRERQATFELPFQFWYVWKNRFIFNLGFNTATPYIKTCWHFLHLFNLTNNHNFDDKICAFVISIEQNCSCDFVWRIEYFALWHFN